MLATLDQVKTAIFLPASSTAQDSQLTQLLIGCDAAIKKYCKQNFESQNITDYPIVARLGQAKLITREAPVRCVFLSGTLTNGSPTITGLTGTGPYSTSQLVVGQAVAQTGNNTVLTAIPAFTTVSGISGSTVTMSQNATASGTFNLVFGLNVYLDIGAFYGQGTSAYQNGPNNSSQLFIGKDYAIEVDSNDGSSSQGSLLMVGSGMMGGSFLWMFPGGGFGAGYGRRGSLTTPLPPTWPKMPGCVRIDATTGYSSIPADLTQACVGLCVWSWQNILSGLLQTNSEGFNGESVSVEVEKGLKSNPALGTVRQMLSRYRRTSI